MKPDNSKSRTLNQFLPARLIRTPSRLSLSFGSSFPPPPKVEKFGTAFAIGDKVMQIENDYMIVVKPRCRMLLKLNAIEQK